MGSNGGGLSGLGTHDTDNWATNIKKIQNSLA